MNLTIDDLRNEYRQTTEKEPAVRWNRKTLIKKITEHRILAAHYAQNDETKVAGDTNPEFEKLAGEVNEDIMPAGDMDIPSPEKRGGYREGSGRPAGQSDERARVERLLALEKPDLAVRKVVQGLNLVLAKFSPLPFTAEQVDSIALGVTLPLYYWFPAVEGAMNPWTLHFQALEYIGKPFADRAIAINKIQQEKNNAENKIEQNKDSDTVVSKPAAKGSAGKGSNARSGSRKKQR